MNTYITVKELIELLKQFPEDLLVVDDCGLMTQNDFKLDEEYRLDESAGCDTEPIKVLKVN